MNIVFELIPIIITVFLIFKGNKIKEYLLNLSIENKLEKKFKNVDAPMQVLFSILLLIVIFAGETYILTNGSNIIEIIISLVITLVSVLNIFWWNEIYYF